MAECGGRGAGAGNAFHPQAPHTGNIGKFTKVDLKEIWKTRSTIFRAGSPRKRIPFS
jgi:hypothetical protein